MTATFPIHLLEEHASTLPIWWQARETPCTAVYLDAHLDLQKISSDKINALKQCRKLDQVKALEAPHHLNPAPDYAFGIENFLFAAIELKLIKRLIWVVPPHIPRVYSSSLLEIVQQMEGVSFTELSSFKPEGTHALRGTLLGLDITLCDYRNLHSLNIDESWYLDIDIDYFVRTPEDCLWVEPANVLEKIRTQLGEPQIATISRAVDSGFTPLSMRFIADYAAAILHRDQPLVSHYQQLVYALDQLTGSQAQAALESCRQCIENMPDCAASHYLQSLAMELNKHPPEQINAARENAIALDKHYAFNLARLASGYPNRHRSISTDQLNSLGSKLTKTELIASPPEIAIGLLYAAHSELKAAWQLLQKQNGEYSNHCELTMAIARGVLQSTEPYKAKPLLEIAAKADKTRGSALLSLGDLAYQAGDIRLALQYYQEVAALMPAWLLPLERQATCLKAMNQTALLEPLLQTIQHRKLQLTRLIQN